MVKKKMISKNEVHSASQKKVSPSITEGSQEWHDPSLTEAEFMDSCKRGDINRCKSIASEYRYDDGIAVLEIFFGTACGFGRLEIAKVIIALDSRCELDLHRYNEEAFCNACTRGQPSFDEFLLSRKTEATASERYSYRELIDTNQVEFVKWLLTLESKYGKFDIHAKDELPFRKACGSGHRKLAALLLSLEETHGRIDAHAEKEEAFREACGNGHLKIVELLLRIEKTHRSINIHAQDDYAFNYACSNGHHEIVRLLLSLEKNRCKFKVHAYDEKNFREACSGGHLGVAQELLRRYPKIDTHALDDSAFCEACAHGHLDVAKWLISLESKKGYIDINRHCDEPFRLACKGKYPELAKWLITLEATHKRIDVHSEKDEAFNVAFGGSSYEVIDLLISLIPTHGAFSSSVIEKAVQSAMSERKHALVAWFLCSHSNLLGHISLEKELFDFNKLIEVLNTHSARIDDKTAKKLISWLLTSPKLSASQRDRINRSLQRKERVETQGGN